MCKFQSYSLGGTEDASLFCIGNYPEIIVIDPFTLEIVMTLSSRVHPDWISAIHVLRPSRRQGMYYDDQIRKLILIFWVYPLA